MTNIFQTDLMHWIVFSLGVINLVAILAVFSSCRVARSWLPSGVTNSGAYKSFFRYHGVIWNVLFGSVLVHMTLAALHTGLPWMH